MQQRNFKSSPFPLSFTPSQIDAEAGIIRGVVMCEVGAAKGHGVHLEQEFIDGLAAYATEHLPKTGLKARFGHPAMSDNTMGKQMGYFRDIRVFGSQLVGDLHLLESADLSPSAPGMRAWMLAMAKEATDFVMSSIVFMPSGAYQYDPKTGEKVQLEKLRGTQFRIQFENEKVYMAFDPKNPDAHLKYTDLVEAGAATNSLFSADMNPDMYAVRAIEFVQDNRDILDYLRANPHSLSEFATKLDIKLEPKKTGVVAALKEFFQSQPDDVQQAAQVATHLATIEELETKLAAEEAANEELRNDLAEQQDEYKRDASQWADQTRELEAELKALKDSPLVQQTQYQETPIEATEVDDSDRFLCPTTQKAMKRYGR